MFISKKSSALQKSVIPSGPQWFGIHCCLSVQDGDRFWRIAETYVRGNTIKYIRVPDEVSRRRGFDRGMHRAVHAGH